MKTFMKKESSSSFSKTVPFRDCLVESKVEPIRSTQHISSALLSGIIVNTKFSLFFTQSCIKGQASRKVGSMPISTTSPSLKTYHFLLETSGGWGDSEDPECYVK